MARGAVPEYIFDDLEKEFPAEKAYFKQQKKMAKGFREDRSSAVVDARPDVCEVNTYDAQNSNAVTSKQTGSEDKAPSVEEDEANHLADETARAFRTFLFETAGWHSIDDKNVDLNSTVNYGQNDPGQPSDPMDNAFFYTYQGRPWMVYGNGKMFDNFAKADDVGGHEMGHGCVEHSTENGLVYLGQSGALNEGYADVTGRCFVDHRYGTPVDQADWLIGGKLILPALRDKGWSAIRTFKAEKAYPNDPQPANMSGYRFTFQDNGGVHIFSKVALNHPFYLFCMNSGHKYSFEVPWEIFRKTLTLLPRWCRFEENIRHNLKVCEELYPNDLNCLKDAWRQAGHKVA